MNTPGPGSDWYVLEFDGPSGCRIDYYLRERCRPFSRTAWRRRISSGQVLVNGRPVLPSRKLRDGDLVAIDPEAAGPPPPRQGIRILHQDDHLLAVWKEAGILVHGVRMMTRDTVVAFVKKEWPDACPCHRLDKLTSGLILFARNSNVARRVQGYFESGKVEKDYLALVDGCPPEDEGVIREPLGPDVDSPVRIKVCVAPTGEPCESRYRVLERFTNHALLSVRLVTGRKHQIRAHLAHLGTPIHGDFLYGPVMDVDYFENRSVNVARDTERWIGLHSQRMRLPHPGGRPGDEPPFEIEAPLPKRFKTLLKELRG